MKIFMFKMPFQTKHFNKNQKVWAQIISGDMAAKVVGRFRGKGKYISAWVNWDKKNREKYPFPKFQKFDVDDNFAKKYHLPSQKEY